MIEIPFNNPFKLHNVDDGGEYVCQYVKFCLFVEYKREIFLGIFHYAADVFDCP
jgi:hypothetical protein